jgi:single-strand DNA-binding protein
MKSMKNSVSLIGFLGSDVQCHTLSSGRKVARVSLATNEFYTDKSGQRVQQTEWHNLTAWGKLADRMEEQLEKGAMVIIEGKLVHRSYDDRNGNKRYLSEILVSGFLQPKPAKADQTEAA